MKKEKASYLTHSKEDAEQIQVFDRRIATLQKFMQRLSTKSNETSSGFEQPNLPRTEQVTFMGEGLEEWIEQLLESTLGGQIVPAQSDILTNIVKRSSDEEVDRIANLFIDRYKNEVAIGYQSRLVSVLAPLCKSEKAVDSVFNYALNCISKTNQNTFLSDRNDSPLAFIGSIEKVKPVYVSQKMQQLIMSKTAWERSLAIAWVSRHTDPAKSKITDVWVDSLIVALSDTTNPKFRIPAGRSIIRHMSSNKKAIEAIYSKIEDDDFAPLFTEHFGTLIKLYPTDARASKKLLAQLGAGKYPTKQLPAKAIHYNKTGIAILLEQLESVLKNEEWATEIPSKPRKFRAANGRSPKGISLPREPSRNTFTVRQSLIQNIGNSDSGGRGMGATGGMGGGLGGPGLGGLGGGDAEDEVANALRPSEETKRMFVDVLRAQFEFGFKKLTPQAREAIFAETDLALAKLLGSGQLYNGQDLEHWLEVFLAPIPPTNRLIPRGAVLCEGS